MTRSLMIVLLAAAGAAAAPVPKGPPLDPFGNGYLGVYRDDHDELRIDRVVEGGPAEKAGVQAGDQLYQVGPIQPTTFKQLQEVIGGLRPGTRVPVTVTRGDKKVSLVITLGERPEGLGQQQRPIFVEP